MTRTHKSLCALCHKSLNLRYAAGSQGKHLIIHYYSKLSLSLHVQCPSPPARAFGLELPKGTWQEGIRPARAGQYDHSSSHCAALPFALFKAFAGW